MTAELRTDVLLAAERGPNRRHKVVARRVFEHIAQCTGVETRLDEHRFGVHRHEHDSRVRIVAADQ